MTINYIVNVRPCNPIRNELPEEIKVLLAAYKSRGFKNVSSAIEYMSEIAENAESISGATVRPAYNLYDDDSEFVDLKISYGATIYDVVNVSLESKSFEVGP